MVMAPGQPLLVVPHELIKKATANKMITTANKFFIDLLIFMFISFKELTKTFGYNCFRSYAKVKEKVQSKNESPFHSHWRKCYAQFSISPSL